MKKQNLQLLEEPTNQSWEERVENDEGTDEEKKVHESILPLGD